MFSTAVWYPHHQQSINMNLPIHQILPVEIMCRIFRLSLSSSPFNDQMTQENGDVLMSWPASKMTTPFTMSSVCRLWREIARSDPRLWNSVYLVATPNKAAQQAYLLREWLALSHVLPLTIEIDCSDEGANKWDSYVSDQALHLLHAIFPHSSRITTFRTRLPPSCLLLPHPSSNIPDPHFTNLITLSVVPLDGDDEENEAVVDIELFQHAVELRQVDIREITFEQLAIPWQNVTKVTTMNVYLEDCIRILRATSGRVEECIFDGILYPMESIEPEPIFLPRLNRLRLDFREIDVSQDLISEIITAPELKTLEYITQDNDDFPVEDFVSCIERSGCTLTALSIVKPSMTVADLQTCLARVAPSLEYLEVVLASTEDLYEINTSKHILARFFPRLRGSVLKGPTTTIQTFLETVYSSHPLQ